MISVWEKNSFLEHDTIIIGGGIVGLSTAASLLEADPHHNILILERGLIPTGASTKNAGFACFGSVGEILSDIAIMGEKRTVDLVKMRYQGLQKLRKRVGDAGLDYQQHGGYEILTEEFMGNLSKVKYVNDLLRPIFSEDVFSAVPEKIEEFGFSTKIVKSLIFNKFEGQIDSGKLMTNLAKYVQRLGAKIITGALVKNYAKNSDGLMEVNVQNPLVAEGEILKFVAKDVVVCTNAYSDTFLKGQNLFPARGQVLITKPIQGLKVQGTFFFDQGYVYFRNYNGRVLLGGARNYDYQGEKTSEMKNTDVIMNRLEHILRDIILPGQNVEIEREWSGIMCFGENEKSPIVGKIEPNVYAAVRMSGMGVAISSQVAENIRDLILSSRKEDLIGKSTAVVEGRRILTPRL